MALRPGIAFSLPIAAAMLPTAGHAIAGGGRYTFAGEAPAPPAPSCAGEATGLRPAAFRPVLESLLG